MARLQPRLAIVNTGDGAGSLPGQLAGLASDASQCGEAADVRPGMRELRLEYRRPHADPLPVPGTRTAELSVG